MNVGKILIAHKLLDLQKGQCLNCTTASSNKIGHFGFAKPVFVIVGTQAENRKKDVSQYLLLCPTRSLPLFVTTDMWTGCLGS